MFEDARSIVSKELSAGERLLWHGQPAQGVRFRSSDILLIPFSVMWGGFAIFWEYSVLSSAHAPFFFMLWGIPFVCVGLYLIFGRFIYDAYCRQYTFYGVTDERVVIVSGGFSRKVKTLSLTNLPEITCAEGWGGRGTITFGSVVAPFGALQNTSWPGASRQAIPQFEMIENARKVYEIIRETQRGTQAV